MKSLAKPQEGQASSPLGASSLQLLSFHSCIENFSRLQHHTLPTDRELFQSCKPGAGCSLRGGHQTLSHQSLQGFFFLKYIDNRLPIIGCILISMVLACICEFFCPISLYWREALVKHSSILPLFTKGRRMLYYCIFHLGSSLFGYQSISEHLPLIINSE